MSELEGFVVIEFGTSACAHCQAAQPLIASAMAALPQVRHIKIEDGKGQRMGRLFGIKLWPSLIFLFNGKEITRLIRPTSADTIREALAKLLSAQAPIA